MGARVLVAHGSKHGSTAEIADRIAATLRAEGLQVDVARARDVRELSPYSAVVLGSAVYMGRWRPEALRLLRRHRRELAHRAVWLFSSGPVGEDKGEMDDPKGRRLLEPPKVLKLAGEIGARGHTVFGGRLTADARGFLMRRMAAATPPEHRDRRDWAAIEAWARRVAADLAGVPDEVAPGPAAPA